MTPAQLARLAAWAGISPETHVYLFIHVDGVWKYLGPDPTDPAADPREVDRVWLADVIHTLTALDSPSSHFADVRFVPQLNGGFYCTADAYVPNSLGRKEHCEFGDSATLALLLAARAAGVPEVIAACGLKESEEG